MRLSLNRIRDAIDDAEVNLEQEIDIIIDFCYDPYGDVRSLNKDEVKDLVKMLKNITDD